MQNQVVYVIVPGRSGWGHSEGKVILYVFIWGILANIAQVSAVVPGPLVLVDDFISCMQLISMRFFWAGYLDLTPLDYLGASSPNIQPRRISSRLACNLTGRFMTGALSISIFAACTL
jgi:hypothetical protein